MDAWLRAVKDTVFHSYDGDVCKTDVTERGQKNMRFFCDKLYPLRKKSNKMRRWIIDYAKAMPDGDICTLEWLLDAIGKQTDQD